MDDYPDMWKLYNTLGTPSKYYMENYDQYGTPKTPEYRCNISTYSTPDKKERTPTTPTKKEPETLNNTFNWDFVTKGKHFNKDHGSENWRRKLEQEVLGVEPEVIHLTDDEEVKDENQSQEVQEIKEEKGSSNPESVSLLHLPEQKVEGEVDVQQYGGGETTASPTVTAAAVAIEEAGQERQVEERQEEVEPDRVETAADETEGIQRYRAPEPLRQETGEPDEPERVEGDRVSQAQFQETTEPGEHEEEQGDEADETQEQETGDPDNNRVTETVEEAEAEEAEQAEEELQWHNAQTKPHSIQCLLDLGQDPDHWTTSMSLNSLGARIRDIRGNANMDYKGENVNRWLGYASLTQDLTDPEANLAYFDIPGCPRHTSLSCSGSRAAGTDPLSVQAMERTRIFGRKNKTGTISTQGTVNFPVPSLPEDFYSTYTMWDRTATHMGPTEYTTYLREGGGQYLASISDKLAPWTSTLFPLNDHWAKKMSITSDGQELVCRTKACRQEFSGEGNEDMVLYFCEVCGNLLLPMYSIFVYCYRYVERAPSYVREAWKRSYVRVCYAHFVNHGENRGRNLFEALDNRGRGGLRGAMYRQDNN